MTAAAAVADANQPAQFADLLAMVRDMGRQIQSLGGRDPQ